MKIFPCRGCFALLIRVLMIQKIVSPIAAVIFFCMVSGLHASQVVTSLPKPSEEDKSAEFLLPIPEKWLGDLDGMKERRLIRIIVPYSKTTYFLDRAIERGTSVDVGRALEEWLNKRYKFKDKALRISIQLIPTPRERLLSALAEGYGDMAAGNLTITPKRQKMVDFTVPAISNVKEIVVTGPTGPVLRSMDDLSGKEVYVRKSSSYYEHLLALNKKLKAAKKREIKLKPADENLEDEDILEMVNAGILPLTIVDDHIAKFWSQVFANLKLHSDIVLNEGGDVAWAVRKKTPQFLAEIGLFAKDHGMNSSFGREIHRKYLRSTKFVVNSTSKQELEKFAMLIDFFKKYGKKYDFNSLMLVALGYQESRLDQSARSPTGAVGVMQILPSTAASSPINIKGVEKSAELNIHAATKYLRFLVDTYLNDPAIDAKNRTLMVFAAYNAGPGNLNKFRELAKRSGLDPNVWFNNVELAAARIVGRETVQYVSNIYKYYIAYKLVLERQEEKEESINKMKKTKN